MKRQYDGLEKAKRKSFVYIILYKNQIDSNKILTIQIARLTLFGPPK